MKKLENNWRYKTLQNLEREKWATEPAYGSHLVKRVTALRKIPLSEFLTEDMRIMIRQEIGLDYLVPLAIEALSVDLFAEGDMYEGDLLQSLLKINEAFWKSNIGYWSALNGLIINNLDLIKEREIELNGFVNVGIT